jgi:RNA polymerase sigma factor (sigma-70 family)
MTPEEERTQKDFTSIPNETLVGWLQQPGAHDPALRELLARHLAWMKRVIERWGTKAGCALEDIQDAQQSCVFYLLAAVRDYHLSSSGEQSASFRTFLWSVVQRRFWNFVRIVRREEKHLDRRVQVAQLLDGTPTKSGFLPQPRRKPSKTGTDPVTNVENGEMHERVQQALSGLDGRSQLIWHEHEDEKTLGQIAEKLGMARRQVKHYLKKTRNHLRISLCDWWEKNP